MCGVRRTVSWRNVCLCLHKKAETTPLCERARLHHDLFVIVLFLCGEKGEKREEKTMGDDERGEIDRWNRETIKDIKEDFRKVILQMDRLKKKIDNVEDAN